MLETSDRIRGGEHRTKKEIRQNKMLQKCCWVLAVMLFVPMMAKDGDPVVT